MIVNLTQHPATSEQLAAGVVDLRHDEHAALVEALTFPRPGGNVPPTAGDVADAARRITRLALAAWNRLTPCRGEPHALLPVGTRCARCGLDLSTTRGTVARVMIGGAPFLMAPLERELRREAVAVLYAFSARESAEEAQADGSVRKVAVFRHRGFVEASP